MTNVLNQARAHWDTISTPTLTFATNDTYNTATFIQNTIGLIQKIFGLYDLFKIRSNATGLGGANCSRVWHAS